MQVIETQLYTGAYTGDQPGEGVRCWRFDGAALQETGKYGGLRNPSYVLPVGKRLYAVEELPDRAGAACFSLDGNGGLSVLWQKAVSYTHLDVYKRQFLCGITLAKNS